MEFVKAIGRIASTALVAAAVVLAVALVGVRLLGFEVYTVLSGSMEPAYKTGSVIWVDRCEPEDVSVGDPITFVLNEDLDVATHRVIEVDEANQRFYTQGDANDAPDGSPVHFNNLIGMPVFTVPYLGYFVSSIQSPPGCYIALIVAAAALVLMLIPELFDKADARKREEETAARERRAQRAGAPGNHDVRRTRGLQAQPAAPARQKPAYAQAGRVQPVSSARQQAARPQALGQQRNSAMPQARTAANRSSPARANDPRRRAAQPNGIPRDSHSKASPRRMERRETT